MLLILPHIIKIACGISETAVLFYTAVPNIQATRNLRFSMVIMVLNTLATGLRAIEFTLEVSIKRNLDCPACASGNLDLVLDEEINRAPPHATTEHHFNPLFLDKSWHHAWLMLLCKWVIDRPDNLDLFIVQVNNLLIHSLLLLQLWHSGNKNSDGFCRCPMIGQH